jgi:hypothetical protein
MKAKGGVKGDLSGAETRISRLIEKANVASEMRRSMSF